MTKARLSAPAPSRWAPGGSELLGETEEGGPPRSVLVGEDADAGLAAQEIILVKQVDHGKTQRNRTARRRFEAVRYAQIDLLVGGDGLAVVDEVALGLAAQPRPRDDVDGIARTLPRIRHPAGSGVKLAVIGIDHHAVGRCEIGGAEIELRRVDPRCLLLGDRQIAVVGEIALGIAG